MRVLYHEFILGDGAPHTLGLGVGGGHGLVHGARTAGLAAAPVQLDDAVIPL